MTSITRILLKTIRNKQIHTNPTKQVPPCLVHDKILALELNPHFGWHVFDAVGEEPLGGEEHVLEPDEDPGVHTARVHTAGVHTVGLRKDCEKDGNVMVLSLQIRKTMVFEIK